MVEQADNHTGFGRSLLVEIEDLNSERVARGEDNKEGKTLKMILWRSFSSWSTVNVEK